MFPILRASAAHLPVEAARRGAGFLAAAIGVAGLVLRALGSPAADGVYADGIVMPATTGYSLVLCGIALALMDPGGEPQRRRHRLGQAFAALALAISTLALFALFERAGAGALRLFSGWGGNEILPVNSAAALWLAATSLLGLGSRRGGMPRTLAVGVFATLVFSIGVFGLIPPLARFSSPSGPWGPIGTTLPAGLAFIALGAGLVAGCWQLAGLRWSIDLRLSAGLAAGVLLILTVSMVAFQRTADLFDTSVAVADIQSVRTRLAEVLAALTEAEAGARGYVSSSDETYLQPYARGANAVARDLWALRQSVADEPAQIARVGQLESVAARELDLLSHMVRAARAPGAGSVAHILALLDQENGAMEEISGLVAAMDHAEIDLLQARQRQNQAEAEQTALLVPVWATAGIVVFGLVFLALNRGIAERLRAEAELQRRNLELAAASRAKDRFLARMSHEFRTPLNAILGFAGTLLMKMHGETSPEQEKALRTIRDNGARLRDMVEQILDVVRLDSGHVDVVPAPVDCAALLGAVGDLVRPAAAAKGLQLAVEPPPEPLTLVCDGRLLRRILDELAGNAVKFTDCGQVRLAACACRGRVAGEGSVEFVVEDSGIGIGEEDRARLFAAFSQVEESNVRVASGAGLGLYLSGRLAGLIGGRIRVDSEPGKGSRFTLEVPGAPAGAVPTARETSGSAA